MKILSRNIKIKRHDLFGEMVVQHFVVSSKKYVFLFHFVYSLNNWLTIRAFSEYHGKAYRRIGVCDSSDIDKKSAKKAIADDEQWRFDYGDVSRLNDMKKCLDMLVEYMLDKDYIHFVWYGV